MMVPNRNNGHVHSTPLNGSGVAQFKEEIRRLRQEAVDFSQKLDLLLDKTGDSEAICGKSVLLKSHLADDYCAPKNRRRRQLGGELPEKEFSIQNSVLTDLFHSKHIRTIANVTVSMLVLWAVLSFFSDFLEKKSFQDSLPSLTLIETAFENYQIGVIAWFKLMMMSFAIFPITRFWAFNRQPGPVVTTFDRIFLVFYCLYQVAFLLMPYRILIAEPVLGIATSIALSLEQMRLMMKMHSFVREVTKRVLRAPAYQAKTNDPMEQQSLVPVTAQSVEFPGFSRYLYFSFAPTLIYRDEYPQTQSTDWGFVLSNFAQVFGCCALIYYIFERYILPRSAKYDPRTLNLAKIVEATTANLLPAAAVIFTTFFGFLHSWLNAWAELLRFGDRLFYKDWWNSLSYGEYYRSWNSVVHDWLYTYIYKDIQDYLKVKRCRLLSMFLVFTVSAVFHEYVVVAMLKFFFPIFYINFGVFGFILFVLVRTKGRSFNMCQWASIILGDSLMITMYMFELSARRQCQTTDSLFGDVFVPRFWSCMQS